MRCSRRCSRRFRPGPASALAQPADPNSAAKLPIARKLYDEGVDAVNKGRWSTAYDKFKASYELVPRPITLFNLAGAQSQTGRLVEAGESYRRFLRDTSDGRFNDLRTDAIGSLDAPGTLRELAHALGA